MSVGQDLLGKWETKRHEEGWPVDAMEANDILSDDMTISRPASILLLAGRERVASLRCVVHESVEPDIYGLRFVVWHSNTPFQSIIRPRDG